MPTVYLDYNATTPLDDEVLEAMTPYFQEVYGNPSSIHAPGQQARNAVELARIQVAGAINASPEEIFFTSGGTEANNTALKGAVDAARSPTKHVISTPIEHSSVLKTARHLAEAGVALTELPVDRHGRVDPDDVRRALRDDTVLVTVGHSNNEIGTLQPIAEIAAVTASHGALFHTDAVQSLGKVPVDVRELGVDLMSLSAHKCYGPKGAGALFVRRRVTVAPLLYGGSQERRFRAGTESVPQLVGMGRAAALVRQRITDDRTRYHRLRTLLEQSVAARIDGVMFHGHPELRLPQTTNLSIDGVDGLTLVIRLDLDGFAVSTGSACSSGSTDVSHVHAALGGGRGASAIRISLGRMTSEEDVRAFVETLSAIVKEVRA